MQSKGHRQRGNEGNKGNEGRALGKAERTSLHGVECRRCLRASGALDAMHAGQARPQPNQGTKSEGFPKFCVLPRESAESASSSLNAKRQRSSRTGPGFSCTGITPEATSPAPAVVCMRRRFRDCGWGRRVGHVGLHSLRSAKSESLSLFGFNLCACFLGVLGAQEVALTDSSASVSFVPVRASALRT